MKGTYILVMSLKKSLDIRIGALGTIPFKEGVYFYIGSAMGNVGSSNLINRVRRHLLSADYKKIRWHIDYLLSSQDVIISRLFLIPSSLKLECILARELLDIADGSIKNFGASDCNCTSHLIYFKAFPFCIS